MRMIRRCIAVASLATAAFGLSGLNPPPAQASQRCVKDTVCVPDCGVSVNPLWVRCYPI